MANNLEAVIESIVVRSSSEMAREIARAVRQALAAEIAGSGSSALSASFMPKRGPGRPKKNAQPESAPTAKAAKPARASSAKLKRRTSKQVARDDAKILAFVRGNSGLRSIDIGKQVGLPKQHLASGLERLRQAGKVKAKGQRSATTYAAA